ncbi:hypothetical protein NLJ89_g9833 [Agrocybe chaxingu]|uniref:F-box domain-containing protein n=1 Tax=Agrocybe chaxingu TaxID=84603 RepID=A0A9W8MQU6_9AGAR|nr:hypothetical protein NLJ89_g9833 [Agrocybe chaxingu]
MTSPLSITSIPPEVLGEIFTHASLNDADAPITIGSVSRTFHRTVRTTPPAWTNLKLKMREPADDGRCIRKAELWFTMAGACLVDLSVQMEMENVMEVALSLHAIGTPSGSTSTAPVKENIPAGWLGSSIVVLPDVLHNYAQCIRAFSLHTTNIAEARVFLSAMYSTPLLQGSIPSYPLRELELRTSSDGTRSPMTPRTHGQAACVTLPRLTNLERLNLVNHPVPLMCLSNVDNVRNLRQLKVVCPLRFAPIPAD